VTIAFETDGRGFQTASVAVPVTIGAATVTAVIVTGLVAGIVAGGVYRPPAEIVPSALDPPATAFTCHVTDVLDSLITLAVNWAVDPSLT
jgi:catabolite regulation protein CreA